MDRYKKEYSKGRNIRKNEFKLKFKIFADKRMQMANKYFPDVSWFMSIKYANKAPLLDCFSTFGILENKTLFID